MVNELITQNDIKDNDLLAIQDYVLGGFYTVQGGKKVPDAKMIQFLANKNKISVELKEAEQTNDYAKVTVKAIAPDGRIIEDTVIHHFETVMNKKIIEMYDSELKRKQNNKGNNFKSRYFNNLDEAFILNTNGSLTPNLNSKGQIKIVKDMFQFKNFAIRDATTKARARAEKAILNFDWRESEEIQLEQEEVEAVNKGTVKYENATTKTEPKKETIESNEVKEAEIVHDALNPKNTKEQQKIKTEKPVTPQKKEFTMTAQEYVNELYDNKGNDIDAMRQQYMEDKEEYLVGLLLNKQINSLIDDLALEIMQQ